MNFQSSQSTSSTPSPRTPPSTPPPIRVPRITTNDIISGSRSRPRRNALFSPAPMRPSMRFPMNNQNQEYIVSRQDIQGEVVTHPSRIPTLPVLLVPSVEQVPLLTSVLTPDNPEYWRVNWRAFLNNPLAFKDAIKMSPVEYQEDINKVLDVIDAQRRGTNHSQPRRL
jgi:hypothetical protein